MFSDLAPQELQVSQLERYDSSTLRRDAESALFAIPLSLSRHRYSSKETLRAVLDARCIVDGSIQEAARWPTECQVIPERIRHIEYNFATPEAFYIPTGKEPRPKPISDELGTVIFRYCPTNVTNYEYLGKLVADPAKTRFTKLRLLCRSLAGNGVYYLTITAPTQDEEVRRKRGVVITARVHPGETPSSWTMKGIIDFLTGDTNRARELRERFVFKLVPMLNPDGVIVGNNRCSLSGKDLNRQYRTVMRESYPSVWHTKLMIRRLLEECGVAIYCDLHAHSRKHNIFAYGCESKRAGCNGRLSEQVFPLMLHKNAADKFSFENCKFHVEKGKEGTGRVVVWSMGVQNSYTMEASMGGSKIGSRCGTHFSIQDYEQIGKAFCETLLDFSDQDPMKEKLRNKIIARLTKEGSSAEEPTNIDLTDYSSDEGDVSQESFSSEEERLEYTDAAWSSEGGEFLANRRRYLCAPPPSPTFVPPRSVGLYRRRARRDVAGRIYLERRRILTQRAVMELPTTDPGSDLCDLTDSADENFVRSEGREYDVVWRNTREHREEIVELSERETVERDDRQQNKTLILPEIVRPRSVSFGELLPRKDHQRTRQRRPRCLRTTLKNPSPVSPTNREARIKLTSLRRQQIWTGIPSTVENNDTGRLVDAYVKTPLSWGVSRYALMHYPTDEEVTLKQSKKVQLLVYDEDKDEVRKTRKKSRRKRQQVADQNASQLKVSARTDVGRKTSRKKNSKLDWQRAVNLNSRIKDARGAKISSSFLTIEADSLKLLAAASTAPPQRPPNRKLEPRRKFRGVGTVASTCVGVGAKVSKPARTCRRDTFCESSTSDDVSSDSGKITKVTKKKQKKKKQQQQQLRKSAANRGTEQIKRASSAKTTRNNV
ncbi:cytosolic carboxypeptidase 2-like protein [Lasius niger]|uniref:Cytosolic carboxypeptidase 2-like protein n=1 Tax=Lasius niger TaxID=67767 RepID=A0A0J7NSE7_LASNI|nr:cytosolic carboxypeptidase 2-like protein [Lasius niger]